MLCFSYILLSTVAYVESEYCKGAMRFEPKFYTRIKDDDPILDIAKGKITSYVSKDTLRALLATSYGYLQILGYNFVRFNMAGWYASPFAMIEDFIDMKNQARFFFNFAEKYKIDLYQAFEELVRGEKGEQLRKFARLWNGREKYVNKLLKAYHENEEAIHINALELYTETRITNEEIEL